MFFRELCPMKNKVNNFLRNLSSSSSVELSEECLENVYANFKKKNEINCNKELSNSRHSYSCIFFIFKPCFRAGTKVSANMAIVRPLSDSILVSRCEIRNFYSLGVYSVPAFESEWYPGLMYLKDSKVYKHHV